MRIYRGIHLVLAIIVLASLLAATVPVYTLQAQKVHGPPINLVLYDVVTKVEDGIYSVIKGSADIFFWPVTRDQLEQLGIKPEELKNVELIPQTSSLDSLIFNPYSDDKPWGACGIGTSTKDNKTHFNPFALREVRFAMNWLINRKYIIDEIMLGSANPQFTVIGPSHPAYPQIASVIEELGLTPEGSFEKGKKMIEDAFEKAKKCMEKYGFDLYKKKDPNAPAGYWWTLKRPDGSEETVTIVFLIRVEDERRQIGDYVANLLEKVGIKVQRVYIERGQVFKLVYGADPRALDWHIYTEGWVSTAESPWIEWDIAWYYASWYYGLLPTWQNVHWGYTSKHEEKLWGITIQKDIEELSKNLVNGVYKGEKYWEVARKLIRLGIEESIRVFLTENVQFFLVNKRVSNIVPGRTTGLYSPFALRTATTPDGILRIVQFSAEAALFMSAWNPVGGMTDIYSTNIWRYVREYPGYWHPTTGEFIPMATTWTVKYNVTVDPTKVYMFRAHKWMTLEEFLKKWPDDWRAKYLKQSAPVMVVFNYKTNAFHDGEDVTLWDILWDIAWNLEWATNDTKYTGEKDPWYHPGIESSTAPLLDTMIGVQIINKTAIAIYGTYIHPVSEAEIAQYYVFYPTWSPIVWMAMEYCVINKGPVSGKSYGWHEGEAERYIDALSSDHLVDIKAALEIMKEGKYVPPYLVSTNELAKKFGMQIKDIKKGVDLALDFIAKHGHAVISNGPFYIDKYMPKELHLELRAFRDPRYPFTADYWIKKLPYVVMEVPSVSVEPTLVMPGTAIDISVNVIEHMISPEEKKTPAKTAWIEVVLKSPAGEEIYSTTAEMAEPGVWKATIPGDVTSKLKEGEYTVEIRVGRFEGIPTIIKTQTVVVLPAITTPTTTAPVTTTTLSPTTPTTPKTTPKPTPTVTTITAPGATVTVYVTKAQTVTKTVASPVTVVQTQVVTSPTTVVQTAWGPAIGIAIVLFIIGLIIGWVIKRR